MEPVAHAGEAVHAPVDKYVADPSAVLPEDDEIYGLYSMRQRLRDGADMTRVAALEHLPFLARVCPDAVADCLVPEVLTMLEDASDDVRAAAGDALAELPPHVLPVTLREQTLAAALAVVRAPARGGALDTVVAWGRVLRSLLTSGVSRDALREIDDIVETLVDNDDCRLRLLACELIAALCTRPHATLSHDNRHTSLTLELCDDADDDVRALAAANLGKLVLLDADAANVETHLLPMLYTMMRDDVPSLRAAATCAMADIVSFFGSRAHSSDFCASVLRAHFVEDCGGAMEIVQDDLLHHDQEIEHAVVLFAETFGRMLFGLHKLFRKHSEWDTALAGFSAVARSPCARARQWCSFNMPAASLIAGVKCRGRLTTLYNALANDEDRDVRTTLAKGFHKTLAALETSYLFDEALTAAVRLLEDDCPHVRSHMYDHFAELLASVLANSHDEQVVRTRVERLLECLHIATYDTRHVQLDLIEQMEVAVERDPTLAQVPEVHRFVLGLAESSSAHDVRRAALTAVVRALQHTTSGDIRATVASELDETWASAPDYARRVVYVDAAREAWAVMDAEVFQGLFRAPLSRLAVDLVPQIRQKASTLAADANFTLLQNTSPTKQVRDDATENSGAVTTPRRPRPQPRGKVVARDVTIQGLGVRELLNDDKLQRTSVSSKVHIQIRASAIAYEETSGTLFAIGASDPLRNVALLAKHPSGHDPAQATKAMLEEMPSQKEVPGEAATPAPRERYEQNRAAPRGTRRRAISDLLLRRDRDDARVDDDSVSTFSAFSIRGISRRSGSGHIQPPSNTARIASRFSLAGFGSRRTGDRPTQGASKRKPGLLALLSS